jgi:hypothetical protein
MWIFMRSFFFLWTLPWSLLPRLSRKMYDWGSVNNLLETVFSATISIVRNLIGLFCFPVHNKVTGLWPVVRWWTPDLKTPVFQDMTLCPSVSSSDVSEDHVAFICRHRCKTLKSRTPVFLSEKMITSRHRREWKSISAVLFYLQRRSEWLRGLWNLLSSGYRVLSFPVCKAAAAWKPLA